MSSSLYKRESLLVLTLFIVTNKARFAERDIFIENRDVVSNMYLASFINNKSTDGALSSKEFFNGIA